MMSLVIDAKAGREWESLTPRSPNQKKIDPLTLL